MLEARIEGHLSERKLLIVQNYTALWARILEQQGLECIEAAVIKISSVERRTASLPYQLLKSASC